MKPFFFPEPFIIARNGGSGKTSPVTLDTIRASFDLDCDAVTLSVGVSGEGTAAVIPVTDQIPPGILRTMSTTPLAQLREEYPGESIHGAGIPAMGSTRGKLFPELETVLQEFPREKFVIDIPFRCKREASVCSAIIDATGAGDRVLITSLYSPPIRESRNILPDAAVTFSLMGAVGIYALFRSGLLYFFRKFRPDALMIPEMIGTSYFANPALVTQVQEMGIRVYVRDVTTAAQMKRLAGAGVNGYSTGDISALKSLLDSVEKEQGPREGGR